MSNLRGLRNNYVVCPGFETMDGNFIKLTSLKPLDTLQGILLRNESRNNYRRI